MKQLLLIFCVLFNAAGLTAASSAPARPAAPAYFLAPAALDLPALLPPPPARDSLVQQAELEVLYQLQLARTPAQASQAHLIEAEDFLALARPFSVRGSPRLIYLKRPPSSPTSAVTWIYLAERLKHISIDGGRPSWMRGSSRVWNYETPALIPVVTQCAPPRGPQCSAVFFLSTPPLLRPAPPPIAGADSSRAFITPATSKPAEFWAQPLAVKC